MAETSSSESIDELKKLFENQSNTTNEDSTIWLTSVRNKLYSMFCSPMKEDYIHEAFKWVSHLCMSMNDFSWISPSGNWLEHECRIFSCVSLLSMTELQILMPTIQRRLTCGDEPEIEDGKILARSATSEDYNRLGYHLVIIESIIKALVKDQEFNEDEEDQRERSTVTLASSLKSSDLNNVLDKLKETMTVICDYLESVHRHWRSLIDHHRDDNTILSCEGSLRIMCVWLSEDPQGFESQCKRFLIDLLIKNLLLKERLNNYDLLIVALHAVCVYDDEMLDVMRRNPEYKVALEEYLKYVDNEKNRYGTDRRKQKFFKLRCGLVKDLMSNQ